MTACPGYSPTFGIGQLDGSKFQGYNCNCWSAGKAADYDTCGHNRPSSSQVRIWTGDTSGGTNLAQVDDALRTHIGVDLDTRYRLPWATFVSYINSGRGAILQGWYGPIADTKFDAGGGFRGNHSIYVPPSWAVEDPLADGRRAGIYKYHGETYPAPLLRTFAGKLNVASSGYRALGDGLCYAAFTRDNEPAFAVSIHPIPPATSRNYNTFTITNGVITGRGVASTGGFSARCTAPRLYKWSGHSSQSLVRILTGSHGDEKRGAGKGQWVRSAYAHEV